MVCSPYSMRDPLRRRPCLLVDGVLMLTNFLKQVQAQRYVMLKHGLNANALALQMENIVDDFVAFCAGLCPCGGTISGRLGKCSEPTFTPESHKLTRGR